MDGGAIVSTIGPAMMETGGDTIYPYRFGNSLHLTINLLPFAFTSFGDPSIGTAASASRHCSL